MGATNDATTGVQAQLHRSSGWPRGRGWHYFPLAIAQP